VSECRHRDTSPDTSADTVARNGRVFRQGATFAIGRASRLIEGMLLGIELPFRAGIPADFQAARLTPPDAAGPRRLQRWKRAVLARAGAQTMCLWLSAANEVRF